MENKIDPKKVAVTGLGLITGWYLAKQSGRAILEIWLAGCRISTLVKSARFKSQTRKETFESAVHRLQLSEADIAARTAEFQERAAWWFVGFALGFGFLIIAPLVTPENIVGHSLVALSAMIFSGPRVIHWHFRYSQCHDRELYSFGSWFSADVWMRRLMFAMGSLLIFCLAIFAASAMAAAGDAAAAATLHAFTPAAGDAAVGFLREMFGPVIDHVTTNGGVSAANADSIVGRMMGPFNAAVLFLGMIFVGYTTVTGTINSAHDGEVLGKKMSEIWVPIRTVGGTALVLPAFGGFCLAQLFVMWMLVQSIGIGNAILSAALSYVRDTKMVSRPHIPDSRPLAASILRSEVCMAAMNKQYIDSGWIKRIVPEEKTWTVANTGEVGVGSATAIGAMAAIPVAGTALALGATAYAAASISYQVTEFHWRAISNGGTNYINPDVCGAVTWEQSAESAGGNGNLKITKGPIMQAHADAVREMIVTLRPVAENIAIGKIPPSGALENAAAAYENRLASAAKTAVSTTSDQVMSNFIDFTEKGGWIYLPAYYNQLIQLNDVMTRAINTLPSSKPVTIDYMEVASLVLQNYEMAMGATEEYIKNRPTAQLLQQASAGVQLAGQVASYTARPDLAPMQAYMQQSDDTWKVPRNWEDMKRILSRPAQGAINQFTQELAGSNLSHVGQIKSVGDTIIGAGELFAMTIFTASGTAGGRAVSWTVGNFFDIGAALSSISSMLSTMIMLIFFFGAICAYWIPFIPFVAGVSAIAKWAILAFEAVIAAPIFAVAHIHPDGHDAVGKAGPGYMHYLNIALRPSLIVIGFFGSILIAQPLTAVINAMFITTVAGAEHQSLSGIVAFIAYTGIYTLIMTSVVHTVFTLTNWLPDNLMRVIGEAVRSDIQEDPTPGQESSVKGALVNIRHGAGSGGGVKTPKETPTGGGEGGGISQADKDRSNAEHLSGAS